MRNYWKRFISTRSYTVYELEQHQRTLNVILWVVGGCSILLSFLNFSYGSLSAGFIVLSLAPISLLALFLNRKGHFLIAAITLAGLMFFAIVFDIYNAGGLTADLGVVAFPVLIVVCSLLFGKRGIYFFSTLSILFSAILAALEWMGLTPPQLGKTDIYDVTTLIILLVGVSILQWVIIDLSEKNLQRIKNSELKLRISYELTLEGLAKALEFRDQDTEGHSQRVVSLSVSLAKKLGLKDDDILNVKRGALLHDIGKLGVPDNILQKPGKLEPDEWKIMQLHPVYGKVILSTIPFLGPCVDIAYCHHENWDGSGYPQGLKGEDIPFFARIFSLADQWDALNSDRVYRKAWPVERVKSYIRENSGRIYDPCLAEAFLEMIENESGISKPEAQAVRAAA
jgi:putative nucleotidyltransferase with HDIG domain